MYAECWMDSLRRNKAGNRKRTLSRNTRDCVRHNEGET